MEPTNITSPKVATLKNNHSLEHVLNSSKFVPTEFWRLTNGHNWVVGKESLLEKENLRKALTPPEFYLVDYQGPLVLPNPPNGNAVVMLADDVKESDPEEALLDMGYTPKVGVGKDLVLGKTSH